MIVSFFEEFPNDINLQEKLRLITFPSNLYIAAKSVDEFKKIESRVRNKNVNKIYYWPILNKEDGYWISPFVNPIALKKVISEINNISTMIDLELPINKYLIFRNFRYYFKNRNIIKKFLKNNNKVLAVETSLNEFVKKILGISYNKTIKAVMFYSSSFRVSRNMKNKILEKLSKKYKIIGLGCLASGIYKNEKIITTDDFNEDLKIAKKNDVEEIILFRLGGFNNEYKKLLRI